jgi:cytochrome c-type biogenesis protein CcmH
MTRDPRTAAHALARSGARPGVRSCSRIAWLCLVLAVVLAPGADARTPTGTGSTAPAERARSDRDPVSPGGTARPSAEDPALEARLVTVTRELRCLVCQNESIADSHAPLAVDMRNQIREQLRSGMSEREVIAFMVDRYGNFVRFRPPLTASTLALWFGPLLLLVGGLVALGVQLRRRAHRAEPPAPLHPDEAARLAALAADDTSGPVR